MKVLSKSRYKLGLECPNKLFFTEKKEYANQKISDPFLEALASGGFQVEELARMCFPDGTLIEGNDWNYEKLSEKTSELLKNENIIIYEAAFLKDNLFVRTDILVKNGNEIKLIEVKAKSFNSSDKDKLFLNNKGKIRPDWKPYLFDIAFQKHVMQLCFPEWNIKSFIMMADKDKESNIDGLNQLFRISRNSENRTGIIKLIKKLENNEGSVLGLIDIDHIIQGIHKDEYEYNEELKFTDSVEKFKEHYLDNKFYNYPPNFSSCKTCEFKTTAKEEQKGLLSGCKHCFKKNFNWTDDDFLKPNIFEIWNFKKGSELFAKNIIFMDQVTKEQIGHKTDPEKLTTQERQWLQIQKAIKNDREFFVNSEGLKKEMDSWKFPLHFIDFETSAVALPFNKGRKPYEQIAFQFSHHIYYENGTIEHANEFISSKTGEFPNFDFVRALKNALDNDDGTIFRFSNHENSILNAIHAQLLKSDEEDIDIITSFIKKITNSTGKSKIEWEGERNMVDLCQVVKDFYYNPLTKGSNSIKMVLPAILESSEYLKKKYSRPLHEINVNSKNFPSDHIWLKTDGKKVISPYKSLPPLFLDWTEEQIEQTLSEIDNIANGGAALTAYAKLQYTDMTQAERDEISNALLKYCELDTLAMVMIYEHFKEDLVTK